VDVLIQPGVATTCTNALEISKLNQDDNWHQEAEEPILNKIERVTSALKGDEPDRPPYSFWYHFGLQHMPGRVHAAAEIDFYRAYDLDFLKVMSDYPYPLPRGLESVTPASWHRAAPAVSRDIPVSREQGQPRGTRTPAAPTLGP